MGVEPQRRKKRGLCEGGAGEGGGGAEWDLSISDRESIAAPAV